VDARTRRCVHRASSRPPPRAVEEIALMVGMGRAERVVKVVRRFERKAVVLVRGDIVSMIFLFSHVGIQDVEINV
jgi:hypothetical protein